MLKSLLMLMFICGLTPSNIIQAAEVDELSSSAAGEETTVADDMIKSSSQVALSPTVSAPSTIGNYYTFEQLFYIVPWQNVIIPKQGNIGPLSGYGPVFMPGPEWPDEFIPLPEGYKIRGPIPSGCWPGFMPKLTPKPPSQPSFKKTMARLDAAVRKAGLTAQEATDIAIEDIVDLQKANNLNFWSLSDEKKSNKIGSGICRAEAVLTAALLDKASAVVDRATVAIVGAISFNTYAAIYANKLADLTIHEWELAKYDEARIVENKRLKSPMDLAAVKRIQTASTRAYTAADRLRTALVTKKRLSTEKSLEEFDRAKARESGTKAWGAATNGNIVGRTYAESRIAEIKAWEAAILAETAADKAYAITGVADTIRESADAAKSIANEALMVTFHGADSFASSREAASAAYEAAYRALMASAKAKIALEFPSCIIPDVSKIILQYV